MLSLLFYSFNRKRPRAFRAIRLYLGAVRPRRTQQYASGERPLDFGGYHRNSLRPEGMDLSAMVMVLCPSGKPA